MFKENTVDSPICLQARDMIEGSACVQIREEKGERDMLTPEEEEREENMDDEFKERFVKTFDTFVDENPDLIPGSKQEREYLITTLVEVQFERTKSEKKLKEQLESLRAAKSKMEDDLQAEILKETQITLQRKEALKAQLLAIYENRQKGEEGMKNSFKLALNGETDDNINVTKSAATTNFVDDDDDYSEFSEEMLRRDYIMELKKELKHLKTENAALLLEVSNNNNQHQQQRTTMITQSFSQSTPGGIAADEDVVGVLADKVVMSRDSFGDTFPNEPPSPIVELQPKEDIELDETRHAIPNLETEFKSILTSSTVSSNDEDEDHQLSSKSNEFQKDSSTTIPLGVKDEFKSNEKTINNTSTTSSVNEKGNNSTGLRKDAKKKIQVNEQTKRVEETINRIKASVKTAGKEQTNSDDATIYTIISSTKNSVQSHADMQNDDETIQSIIASAKIAVETNKKAATEEEESKNRDEAVNNILASAKHAAGPPQKCEEDGIIDSIIQSARREVVQAGEQVEKYDKKLITTTLNNKPAVMSIMTESPKVVSSDSAEEISPTESDVIMVEGTTACGNSMVCVEEVYEHLNDDEAIITCNDDNNNESHVQTTTITPKNIVSEKESVERKEETISDSVTKDMGKSNSSSNKEEEEEAKKKTPDTVRNSRPQKEFKTAPQGTFEDMFKFYESQLEEANRL